MLLKILAHEGLKITVFACYCLNIKMRKKVVRELQRFKLHLRITNKWTVLFYMLLFYFFQLLLSFCLYNFEKNQNTWYRFSVHNILQVPPASEHTTKPELCHVYFGIALLSELATKLSASSLVFILHLYEIFFSLAMMCN